MTPDSAGQIETKGYNRGLILGFTMAESLLLVVFCLLLVTAAIIVKERERAESALKELASVSEAAETQNRKVAALEAEVVSLTSKLSPDARSEYDDDWRELVLQKDAYLKVKDLLAANDASTMVERVEALLATEGQAVDVRQERDRLLSENRELSERLAKVVAQLAETEAALAKTGESEQLPKWPPIISLTEAGGYFFRSGSAELSASFTDQLTGNIANLIAANLKNYGADIVEVIGHTDEQPISRTNSNLDKNAIAVLSATKSVTALEPADNAGLGLARAISVANVLRDNHELSGITVLPLSAAQLILPGDRLTSGQAGNVETRRRIEIRIRRRDVEGG